PCLTLPLPDAALALGVRLDLLLTTKELEERTLPNVTTNGSQLFGRDWRQRFRMETRYRGHKTAVPAPGPTGVSREDLPDGGVVKMCQGVKISKGGQLCLLPESGAAWKAAEEERQEERERWDALRLAFAPLEKKRAQEQTAQGGKAGSARGDLKATTALEDEYAWGFDGRPPPIAKTRKALRARDPLKIASAFMQKLGQESEEKKSAGKVCPFGQIEGVAVGCEYTAKGQMAHAGLHTVWSTGMVTQKVKLRGNTGRKKEVAAVPAIVMAGGYSDDADGGDEFVYTGAGGNDGLHTKLQFSDQSWEGKDNKALACSCDLGLPVRVIRGQPVPATESFSKTIFVYDGLYILDSYWDEVGTSGYQVCKFLFRRLPGQPRLTSSRVHAAASARDLSQRDGLVLDPTTGKPFDLSGGLEPTPVYFFDPRRTQDAVESRPLAVPVPRRSGNGAADAHALVDDLLQGAPVHLLRRSAAFVYTPTPLYALNAKPRGGRLGANPSQEELMRFNQRDPGPTRLPRVRLFIWFRLRWILGNGDGPAGSELQGSLRELGRVFLGPSSRCNFIAAHHAGTWMPQGSTGWRITPVPGCRKVQLVGASRRYLDAARFNWSAHHAGTWMPQGSTGRRITSVPGCRKVSTGRRITPVPGCCKVQLVGASRRYLDAARFNWSALNFGIQSRVICNKRA
ncbi:hypothetical protein CYMTET_43260, partial [Cymbomonas tetramitiformis]